MGTCLSFLAFDLHAIILLVPLFAHTQKKRFLLLMYLFDHSPWRMASIVDPFLTRRLCMWSFCFLFFSFLFYIDPKVLVNIWSLWQDDCAKVEQSLTHWYLCRPQALSSSPPIYHKKWFLSLIDCFSSLSCNDFNSLSFYILFFLTQKCMLCFTTVFLYQG